MISCREEIVLYLLSTLEGREQERKSLRTRTYIDETFSYLIRISDEPLLTLGRELIRLE